MAKVSVIVPFYNVEKYIGRCLESLVKQTLQDIEIIIVNDGSQDSSIDIVKKYVDKFPLKFRYFEKQNGGLSSARNFGIKYATGEYIAFLDSDDYVEKNMYEEMYKTAIYEKADMVECDFLWEWEDASKVEKNKEQGIATKINAEENEVAIRIKKDTRRNYKNKAEIMKKPRVVAWNKLIKRSILENTQLIFPEGLIYEDLEFYFKLLPYINRISYINKYFVHYIQRSNSIANTQSEKNADIFQVLKNIDNYYKEQGIYEKYKKELRYMYKRILLGSSMKRILKIKDKRIKWGCIISTYSWLLKNRY